MSRELKFRVYIPDHKKFSYFELGEFEYPDRYLYQDKYPVQQYTGMTDRKGKEIYEGDILVEKHNDGEGDANIGQVFFAAGAFMINGDGILYDHVYSVSPDILEDYTVEGNIFENPDLLK